MSQPASVQGGGDYSEDEILGLITDLYRILIRLGHFEETEVIWSPPEGHSLDLSVLEHPDRIDPRVISLMKRLPYAAPPYKLLAPAMHSVNYHRPVELARSRDIDKRNFWAPPHQSRLDQSNALPTVLLLLDGEDSTDPSLILDVKDNTIRYFGTDLEDDYNKHEAVKERRIAHSDHYLNWPAVHAPTYIKRMLQKYNDANWVPIGYGGVVPTDDITPEPWYGELRRTLTEDYMWPGDSFRQDDWKREGPDLVRHFMEEWE